MHRNTEFKVGGAIHLSKNNLKQLVKSLIENLWKVLGAMHEDIGRKRKNDFVFDEKKTMRDGTRNPMARIEVECQRWKKYQGGRWNQEVEFDDDKYARFLDIIYHLKICFIKIIN
jgi:hypothetical protein